MSMYVYIIESVDSLCRDGTDTPISLNIQNCSKLPNAAVISLFRHTTWSRSSSVPENSLKVGKIIRYTDTRKTAKTPISPSSSSSVFSRQTYHKIGTSAHLHFCTKQLLSGVCMILDKEILRRTFPNTSGWLDAIYMRNRKGVWLTQCT